MGMFDKPNIGRARVNSIIALDDAWRGFLFFPLPASWIGMGADLFPVPATSAGWRLKILRPRHHAWYLLSLPIHLLWRLSRRSG